MAYCTNAQVASEFKSITFDATSKITDTEVDRFIEEADAEIDAKLGVLYTTPITGTEALKVVRTISIYLVADRVREIMQIKNITTTELQQGARPANSAKVARQMLDNIVSRKLLLSDAELTPAHGGVKSYAYDEDVEHTFEKGTDQW